MAVAQETFEQLTRAGLAELDPEIADAARAGARAAARADRADRLRELHLAVGARGDRLDADEQVRRGLSGQALLRRLRGRRRDRGARARRGRRSSSAPSTRTCSRTPARRRTWPSYFAVPRSRATGCSALSLDHGGHLTHGLKVNFSGKLYEFHHYGVSRETMMVDYDEVLAQAKEVRPKLIVCGGSAYPRTVEADRFREIADEVGALLMCDMAHFSGLVAAGLHPNPVPHCDFVTSTTHKTLAGPRAGFVLCREEHAHGARPRELPGHAGRPADAHDRREGDVLPDRRDRRVPRLPAAGPRERRRARGGPDRRRLRRAHRRHRHAPRAARPARDRLDGPRGAGAARGVQADREPQHGAVRRAPADGRLGRPASARRRRRCAASTRTTSARSRRSSSAAAGRRRRRRRCARRARALCDRGRCTRASAATRPTSRDAQRRRGHAPARPAQARRTCATRTRRR